MNALDLLEEAIHGSLLVLRSQVAMGADTRQGPVLRRLSVFPSDEQITQRAEGETVNILAELLPLFFVRWYSNWVLQRYRIEGMHVANPRPGVFIEVDP